MAVRGAEVLDAELLGYPLLVRLWIRLVCQRGKQERYRSLIVDDVDPFERMLPRPLS